MGTQTALSSRGESSASKGMTSQLYWALLGLLLAEPGHGYQLFRRFEDAYGDVLSLSSESHTYTALKELSRRGLIEEDRGITAIDSGAHRQVNYRATAEGSRRYRERLAKQAGEDRRQTRLFVLQLAAFEHEPDVALEILDGYEKASLKEATRIPPSSTSLADQLLSEESRLAMEGRLPWIEYARSVFSALATGGKR